MTDSELAVRSRGRRGVADNPAVRPDTKRPRSPAATPSQGDMGAGRGLAGAWCLGGGGQDMRK